MSTMTESRRVRVRMQTVVADRPESEPRPMADYVKAGMLAVALAVDAGCWWGVCRLVRMWAGLGDA